MPRRLAPCLASLALAVLPGCLYSHIRFPLDTNLDRTNLGSKTGESQLESTLYLVAWGDAGTRKAAENGGITTIHHADQEMLLVLFGLYYRHRTIVYGD
ncbi:MAG: TRL-like family protein [Planctomycetes bacterium]|nr:TRL-like family protein [Planctomycetota bacterium]